MPRHLQFFTFLLVPFVLCGAHPARAQIIEGVRPARLQVDAIAGFGFMGSKLATTSTRFGMNGVSGAAVFNANSWLGVVADAGIYHQGNVAQSGYSLTVSSIQFGPRIKLPGYKRLSSFVQGLAGVGHAGGTLYTRSLGNGAPPLGANNSLVFSAGGGADWKLNSGIAIRLLQAEYFRSQFLNGSGNGNRQGSLRLSAGFVLTFSGY